MWLFVAFIAVPLIEIGLFIQVGGSIGLWPTLGVVVLTAIIGTSLVRNQGRVAIGNLQRSFSQLDDPSEPLAHGAMILIAGVLLLTPGFFTDATGFALLIPAIRTAVIKYVRTRVKVQSFTMGAGRANSPHGHDPRFQRDDDIIEGDFTEVDPTKRPTHKPSEWTKH